MSWVPIPPTLWNAAGKVVSGSPWRILWRASVLLLGLAVLGWLLAIGSYLAAGIASMIVSIALSDTVRGILLDIWNARGTRL